MRSVVLSTLPHFLCIPILLQREGWLWAIYAGLIGASSCASVAWHSKGEPGGLLFVIDYGLAAAWTAADLLLATRGGLPLFVTVAYLNGLTVLLNRVSDLLEERRMVSYEIGHTAWHCLSWSKAILVAWLLSIQS
jgi:hypothetical protein